jgi:hypothetical protein
LIQSRPLPALCTVHLQVTGTLFLTATHVIFVEDKTRRETFVRRLAPRVHVLSHLRSLAFGRHHAHLPSSHPQKSLLAPTFPSFSCILYVPLLMPILWLLLAIACLFVCGCCVWRLCCGVLVGSPDVVHGDPQCQDKEGWENGNPSHH